MPVKLSQVGEDQLSAKTVKPTYRLYVNGSAISKNRILSYSYSAMIEYGAMVLSLEILNQDYDGDTYADYTPENTGASNPFQFGKLIELWEGLQTTSNEEFKKFTGLIRQVEARKNSGRNTIFVTAMDYIVRMEDLDIEYTFEATKQASGWITLTPNLGLVDGSRTEIADTFNSPNPYWAENPPPVIKLIEIANNNEDVLFDGFEIHKISGQVVLGQAVDTNNVSIKASYYYYGTGAIPWFYVEDAIRQIITKVDGYGNTPFTDSDMTQTLLNADGASTDSLVPCIDGDTTDDITYLAKDISSADTTISVLNASKLPNTSGYIKIEDEYIQYAGKSGNSLTGCTRSLWGSTAAVHSMAVPIRQAWEARRLWYLNYSNVITNLVSGNFTITGTGGTFSSFDKRYGRVILTGALSGGGTVTCNVDYSFYTLQATGVTFVYVIFRKQDTKNRFEAIQAFRKILAPNYILRTKGDGKIWGEYLSQKSSPDYTLKLATSLSYAEDTDLYTRAVVFGQNASPVSINAKALVSGFNYSSSTTGTLLQYEPIDKEYDGYYVLSGPSGVTILDTPRPVLYMNGLKISDTNQLLQQRTFKVISVPRRYADTILLQIIPTPAEISKTLSGYGSYNLRELFIQFPDRHISRNQPIDIYNANTFISTIPANSSMEDYMVLNPVARDKKIRDYGVVDYEAGTWIFWPTHLSWNALKAANNADYMVYFADGTWTYENRSDGIRSGVRYFNGMSTSMTRIQSAPFFLLLKDAFPNKSVIEQAAFTTDFTYKTYISNNDWGSIVDRRSDTKWQVLWDTEPASDLILLAIDLQVVTDIDLIDIASGFYTGAASYQRRYAFTNTYSLQYSINGTDYYLIGKDTTGFNLSAGDVASFDSAALGEDFQARYLRLHLDKAEKVNYGPLDKRTGKIPDVWMASIVEIRIYKDVVLMGEAKLSVTDPFYLKAGDIVYKDAQVNEYLDTQEKCNNRAAGLLAEFSKNHSKAQVEIVYHPSLMVGDTITVIDSINNVNRNYFIESVISNNGRMSLTLGYYP